MNQHLFQIIRSSHAMLAFSLVASTLALAVAWVSQYGFGLAPCDMCYWQRIPYFAIIAVGSVAWLLRRKYAVVTRIALWLIACAFVINVLLSGYHAGVEWQWWQGPSACSGGINGHMSIDDIRAQLLGAAAVSCSEAAIRILGLSMAGWNALYALACALFLVSSMKLQRKAL